MSIFGSARTKPDHAYYQLAESIGRQLSDAGFTVISGGGPGIMEAVNKGAYAGRSLSVGLNIQLPHEQASNAYQDVSQTFRHFFARKVMFAKFAPISTITWCVDILSDRIAGAEWHLMHVEAETVADGYSSQRMAVWDAGGALVLVARQNIAIFG